MQNPLTKKNVKSILAISAALAILGGVLAAGIVKNGVLSDEIVTSQVDNTDPIDDNGLRLKHVKTVQGDGAHLTKIFSYTITPSNASKEVTLDISWQDKAYTEDTANYFTTSIDTSACEITIKCIKAFDHVAVAKITSKIDVDLNASITLNYVQKFLRFQAKDELARCVMREDTINTYKGPSDEASFLKMIQTQSTAVCYPLFSEVYTKEYPAGHNATYSAYYLKSKCYTADPDIGQELILSYEAAMKTVEEEAGGGLWQKQTQADLIEGIAKVYERLTYDEQRLLNAAGYIGIKRHYPTHVTLGDLSDDWSSFWVIKVDVKSLRSYLADVTVTLEESNLDF